MKKICLHYVNKTSGEYEDNQAAARYVHQMADEVIKQLAGVAAQIKWHEQEPELYKTLLEEWKQFFPESLGIHGSPKAIALKLARQTSEIDELRRDVEELRATKDRDIEKIMLSVDAQLHAARSTSVHERAVSEIVQDKKLRELDNDYNEVKQAYEAEIERLHSKADDQLMKQRRQFERELKSKDDHIQLLKNAAVEEGLRLGKEAEARKFEWVSQRKVLQKELKELKKLLRVKEKKLQVMIESPHSEFSDEDQIIIEESEDDELLDDQIEASDLDEVKISTETKKIDHVPARKPSNFRIKPLTSSSKAKVPEQPLGLKAVSTSPCSR